MQPGRALVAGAAIGSGLWLFGTSIFGAIGVSFAAFLMFGGWGFAKKLQTFPRDFHALKALIATKREMRHYEAAKTTIPDIFVATLAKHKDKAAILYEDETWTFQDVEDYSNAVANYFRSEGFDGDDVVAIVLENSPQYVGLWLGMAKVGIHAALINTNLRGDALKHCVTISEAKAIVYGKEFSQAVADIAPSLVGDEINGKGVVKMMCVRGYASDIPGAVKLDEQLEAASKLPPASSERYVKSFAGTLFYIYTSGTTGLPKPAVIKHSRYYVMSSAVPKLFGVCKSDIVYTSLPLYHTNATVLVIGQMITQGCTIALRKKFSASNFWKDCIKYQCTVVIYIGEICRFLLAQPSKPEDTQHSVRIAFGNGLRAHIWEEFKNRFHIAKIGEFYGSTEGNVGLINTTGKVGAVGFFPLIAPSAYPLKIIRINPDTNEPVRNSTGFCEVADVEEPGEIIGKIEQNFTREFSGYKGLPSQSQKKIMTDVFVQGDKYFRSGDILRIDEQGYVYFTDRTGDTFRWRGENVSTTEVENMVSKVYKNAQVACYGVEVPGAEGRAGMIAIAQQQMEIDCVVLARELQERLPAYAVPLFVRFVEKLEYTGTEKIMKLRMREEAFDMKLVSDPMHFLDPSSKTYVPLTEEIYVRINEEKFNF